MLLALVGCCAVGVVLATPLDDYVNKVDSNYKWFDTKQTFK